MAQGGLRVVDYAYTMAFQAPSGQTTPLSRAALLVRRPLAGLSPWLLSKTLGGVSLMLLALAPGWGLTGGGQLSR